MNTTYDHDYRTNALRRFMDADAVAVWAVGVILLVGLTALMAAL